jgi:hypothetical protein
MRTTVDIPDTKYRLLKSRAASEGTTVKAMVMRGSGATLVTFDKALAAKEKVPSFCSRIGFRRIAFSINQ